VMRALGLLLRQRQHSLGRLGEAFERIHACPTSRGIVAAGPPVCLACLGLTDTFVGSRSGLAVHSAPAEGSHTQSRDSSVSHASV
jgi:hypothetical protein